MTVKSSRYETALGPVLVATKGYSATETVNAYRRAWGLIESTKEAENEDAVFTGLFISHYNLAEFSEGLAIAEGFLRRVEADTETGPRCIAHRTVAASCNSIGDFPKARRHAELALAFLQIQTVMSRLAWRFAHDIGVAAMCHLAIAQFHCGYIDQSARMSARALATARRLRHANTLGYALFYAGVLPRYNRREFTLLLDHARNLAAHGHKHGQPQWTAWGICFQAPALIAAGRNGGQSTCAVRVSAPATRLELCFRPAFLEFLGAAQLALGQVDQALEAASKALFKARCTRECWIVPELLELLARACPVDNRPKAEQELQEAIACHARFATARLRESLPSRRDMVRAGHAGCGKKTCGGRL